MNIPASVEIIVEPPSCTREGNGTEKVLRQPIAPMDVLDLAFLCMAILRQAEVHHLYLISEVSLKVSALYRSGYTLL